MDINLKATVDLSDRLYSTIDRLIAALDRLSGVAVPAAPAIIPPPAEKPKPKSIPVVDTTAEDKKAAEEYAAKLPELNLSYTNELPSNPDANVSGEDVRRAVNSVRERIIGKDWEEQRQNGSERHDRYWTDITVAIKQLAARFGVTTAKAVPAPERAKFIAMLDGIGLDNKGNVTINTPF